MWVWSVTLYNRKKKQARKASHSSWISTNTYSIKLCVIKYDSFCDVHIIINMSNFVKFRILPFVGDYTSSMVIFIVDTV